MNCPFKPRCLVYYWLGAIDRNQVPGKVVLLDTRNVRLGEYYSSGNMIALIHVIKRYLVRAMQRLKSKVVIQYHSNELSVQIALCQSGRREQAMHGIAV